MKEIRIAQYGDNTEAVILDPEILKTSDQLIFSTKKELASIDRKKLLAMVLELGHLAEAICLHSAACIPMFKIWSSDVEPLAIHTHNESAWKTKLAGALNSAKQLMPIYPLTIDDMQYSRLMHRWAGDVSALQATLLDLQIKPPSQEQIEVLLAGILAEELTGAPYYPSMQLLSYYLPTSGIVSDMQTYSLLLDAYLKLREGDASKKRVRSLLGGLNELTFPPILTIILSRMNRRADFVPVLLELKRELAPLRIKMRELSTVAASETPGQQWEKELNKILNAIEGFSARYGRGGTKRRSVATLAAVDVVGQIKAEIGKGEVSGEGSGQLNISGLIAAGIETVSGIIRQRRISPLPSMANELAQLPPMLGKLSELIGVKFKLEDISAMETLSQPYENLWKKIEEVVSSRKNGPIQYVGPDPNDFRKTEGAEHHIQTLDFDFLVRSFNVHVKAKFDTSYTRVDYLLDTGFVLLGHNCPKNALRQFSDAVREFPSNAEAYHGVGVTYRKLKALQKAGEFLKIAVKLSPKSPAILNDYATVLMESNDWIEASRFLRKILDLKADEVPAICNLATCLSQMGDIEGAVKVLNSAIELGVQDYRVYLTLGKCQLEGKELTLAEQAFLVARRAAPTNYEVMIGLGHVYGLQQKYGQASKYFRKSLQYTSYDDQRKNCLELWISALISDGDWQSAVDKLPFLIKMDPHNGALHHLLGEALVEVGRHEDAQKELESALRYDSENIDAAMLLAKLKLRFNEPLQALQILELRCETVSGRSDFDRLLGEVYVANAKFDEAVSAFKRAAGIAGLEKKAAYNAAVKLDEMQQYEAAIQMYKIELDVNPAFDKCHSNLAGDLCEMGRPEEALIYAQAAVSLAPHDLINWNNLLATYYYLGDKVNAVETARHILAFPIYEVDDAIRAQAEALLGEFEENH